MSYFFFDLNYHVLVTPRCILVGAIEPGSSKQFRLVSIFLYNQDYSKKEFCYYLYWNSILTFEALDLSEQTLNNDDFTNWTHLGLFLIEIVSSNTCFISISYENCQVLGIWNFKETMETMAWKGTKKLKRTNKVKAEHCKVNLEHPQRDIFRTLF